MAGDTPARYTGNFWQVLWFFLHLAAVYALVQFCAPWFSGWTAGRLLPVLQHRTSLGPFEFFFSHLFVFNVIPAVLVGLLNARFKHKAAQFVWVVPTAILAYKFFTFPTASVFASPFSGAFHQYFEGGFPLPGSWTSTDIRSEADSFDILRALAQLQFTAPFYAGVGYSFAAWIGRRTDLASRIAEQVKKWEQAKFEDQH